MATKNWVHSLTLNVTQTKQLILAFLPSICDKDAINQWMKFLPGLWGAEARGSLHHGAANRFILPGLLHPSKFSKLLLSIETFPTLAAYLALSFLSQMHFTRRLARRRWQAQTVSQCFRTSVPTWMSCHLVQELIHTLKTRATSSRVSVNSISQLLSNQTHPSFFMMQLDSWDCGLG